MYHLLLLLIDQNCCCCCCGSSGSTFLLQLFYARIWHEYASVITRGSTAAAATTIAALSIIFDMKFSFVFNWHLIGMETGRVAKKNSCVAVSFVRISNYSKERFLEIFLLSPEKVEVSFEVVWKAIIGKWRRRRRLNGQNSNAWLQDDERSVAGGDDDVKQKARGNRCSLWLTFQSEQCLREGGRKYF